NSSVLLFFVDIATLTLTIIIFSNNFSLLFRHFELKISQLPASFTKLRLYFRYLRWVEHNYPSLGRTADLETLLYRCVRDVGQLDGVQNDQDFVDVWLRLIEYCAQPTELFELLFRQGVGTMCAKFYVTWANLLESKGILTKTAAVYAHGLRAGAKPASWLEDRTESFLARYFTHLDNTEDSGSCFTNTVDPSVQDRPVFSIEPARQQLAALRLVETSGTNENASGRLLKAPALRTSEMWHPHQSGLGSRNSTVRTALDTSGPSLGHRPQPRVVCLSHSSSADSENPFPLLHTLPPLSRGDSTGAPLNPVRPLSKPSQWQKENCPKPGPWKNEQIDRSKLLPPQSTRSARASFEVYSEEGTDASSAVVHYPPNMSVPELSAQQKPSKRKGLAVLRGSEDQVSRSRSSAPRLTMSVFAVLFGSALDDSSAAVMNVLSAPEETGAERLTGDCVNETSGDVLQQLNLPSLPQGRLPQDAEFCIPLHLIYGGADEMCWEMHRASCLAPELAAHAGYDQAVTKAPVEDEWLTEEYTLQCELEQIVQQTEEAPKLPDDNSVEFTSGRSTHLCAHTSRRK
ncbi:hypothetical protein FGIG_08568, partial [Fasciola gigantica]